MSKANNTLSIVAAQSFDSIGAMKSAVTAIKNGSEALEIINTHVKALRANGVKFGKSVKSCQHRQNLADVMRVVFGEKATKTQLNYATSFVKAVNDGEAFSFSGSKGKAAPDGEAKKATPKTDDEKMLGALLNVWKLSEVAEGLLIQIEGALADGTPLAEALAEVLKAHGVAVE